MGENSYDLIVLGGGPAGYTAALRAKAMGSKVCLIERDLLGGTCLNRGCIPTKCFYHSTKVYSKLAKGVLPEITFQGLTLDYGKMLLRKNNVVQNLREGLKTLLNKMGVQILNGRGFVSQKNEIKIVEGDGAGSTVKGGMILISTGSSPGNLPFLPSDPRIFNTDSIWDLEKPPLNLLIIGGGVIGIEAATIYSMVSKRVTVVEVLPEILANVSQPMKRIVSRSLEEKGVEILTGKKLLKILCGEKIEAVIEGRSESLYFDSVLVAVGRKPNSQGVFDEKLGITLKNGAIEVAEDMQTGEKGVYAAGDVIGNPMLAHTAAREAIVAVNNGLGFEKGDRIDLKKVPEVIFADPEIAQVGFIPGSGRREPNIKVGRFPYLTSSKALCEGESEGFVEIVYDEALKKIVGGGIIGAQASDLIGEILLAVNGNLTPELIEKSIHPHPTLTEMIWEASADTIGKAIYKIRKNK